MVITSIGQVAIGTPDKRFILTPSLAAIASLANPVEMYSDLLSPETSHEWRVEVAHAVLVACSDDKSIKDWLGLKLASKPRLRKGVLIKVYRDVYVDDLHAVVIAESLLFHGMIGKIEHKKEPADSAYSNHFEPLEWVSSIIAHLGVSEHDAWQMTMTSVLSALKTKFPPSKEEKQINEIDENKVEFDSWYESIYGAKK